jgi:6-pyruvoyltetrahydropterin/6-carboxytetrahydropterin synthase
MSFKSTKIIDLGSCAFRQPKADSHCKFIHGYRLKAKFWFEASHLDKNNWVVDFGGLKQLKQALENQFDHTTCISVDDPHVNKFKQLAKDGICDLRIMNGVGIEKFAEYCQQQADQHVSKLTDGRCKCVKVEVFEHENNSAIYESTSNEVDIEAMDAAVVDVDIKTEVDKLVSKSKNTKNTSTKLWSNKQTNKWIDPESTNVWGL